MVVKDLKRQDLMLGWGVFTVIMSLGSFSGHIFSESFQHSIAKLK